MDEFVELLRKTLEIANKKNETPLGNINLFDDGTVTYQTGVPNNCLIAHYDSLQEFVFACITERDDDMCAYSMMADEEE